jgi:capsule polysaccharide modification protein KpsS
MNSSDMTTDKIIFWNQGEFFSFLLANSLQKKINGEFYEILDIPDRQKPFYRNQKLVDFKKIWFFHDEISKPRKEVDIEFLTSFEEKYNINLWLLALNERLFNEYNEFYKFSAEEILSILEDECKLFEKIIEEVKPKFLISFKSTFHHHELFHQMCKVSGVKPLIFGASVFANRCIISEEPNILDDKRTVEELESSNRNFEELEKYWKKFELRKQTDDQAYSLRKSKIPKINAGIDFLLSKNITENNYGYYGHTKPKALSNYVGGITKKKIRSDFMDKNFSKTVDSKHFVYFPLHQTPERELLIASPFNTNQIETIKHISKSLPIDYRLLVKEHPAQVTREWRDISFYKEILSIPNVEFIHHSVKSADILKKCSLVITIHGAVGLEAAIHQKPAIIFSDFFYSILPSVYKLESIEELPATIRKSLQTNVNASDVDKFLNFLESNSIDWDLFGFESDYHNYFLHDGNLLNVEINEKEVKEFIKKYEPSFDMLADEYIKKIQH